MRAVRLAALGCLGTLALAISSHAQEELPPLQQFPGPELVYPNVLVILADDIGVDMLCSYGLQTCNGGVPMPQTPNIDTLVAKGVRFTDAWANPLCSPTRSTVLTGRYAWRTGIGAVIEKGGPGGYSLPDTECTLPELVADSNGDYRSGGFGKWHLESPLSSLACPPTFHGFGTYEGHFFAVPRPQVCGGWTKQLCPAATTTNNTQYLTTTTVDDAINWITTVQDRPWVCYLAPQAPYELHHTPDPTLLYTMLPSNPQSCSSNCADVSVGCEGQMGCIGAACPIPCYVAATEALDRKIGDVLNALGPKWWKNTTIFFVGDNGTPNNVNTFWDCGEAKATVWNGGVHVPFIISGARVHPNMKGIPSGALANTVDVFPTVAAITGAAIPDGLTLDGVSLMPVIRNQASSVRPWIYAEMFDRNGLPVLTGPLNLRTIRDDFYKVIRQCDGVTNDQIYAVSDLFENTDLWTAAVGSGSTQLDVSYNTLTTALDGMYTCP